MTVKQNTIAPISFIEGADMIINIIKMIFKIISMCLKIMKQYLRGPSGRIDLSNIFPRGIEDIIDNGHYEKRFRLCKSDDEYKKEVVDYYRYHRDSFFLDQKSKDGHFRA
jgi:hypothetical protein